MWLRLNGCPWNKDTFTAALKGGASLVTLQWMLREDEDLLYNNDNFLEAVKRGDMEILEWLCQVHCVRYASDTFNVVSDYVCNETIVSPNDSNVSCQSKIFNEL